VRRLALLLGFALLYSCGASSGLTVDVVDLNGLDAALAKQRGSGVLLNFWAMWCAPCVEELPDLMQVAKEYEARGGRVVLVSYDLMIPKPERTTVRERVSQFAKAHGFEVPILIYDAPDFDAINTRFKMPGGVPVTLAIDAQGKIVDVQDGAADKARFEQMMDKALGKR
jgi:thiol-disulfide isomerase/thioredoxin